MKARVEVVIRDEEGKILGQLDSYSMELGAQSLHEIEGAVEDWRQKVLPDVTAELLDKNSAWSIPIPVTEVSNWLGKNKLLGADAAPVSWLH